MILRKQAVPMFAALKFHFVRSKNVLFFV